jgi:hypothetical protein
MFTKEELGMIGSLTGWGNRDKWDLIAQKAKVLSAVEPVSYKVWGVDSTPAFDIYVDRRHGDKWAIRNGQSVYNAMREDWEIEPSPSNRDERFVTECYFENITGALLEAVSIAKDHQEDYDKYVAGGRKGSFSPRNRFPKE